MRKIWILINVLIFFASVNVTAQPTKKSTPDKVDINKKTQTYNLIAEQYKDTTQRVYGEKTAYYDSLVAQKAYNQMVAKYGARPYRRSLRIDDWDKNFTDIFVRLEAQSKIGTKRHEYFTIAFNEGCQIYMDKHYGKKFTVYMDGFRYLGIDDFKTYYDTLKTLGLLRPDFEEGVNKDFQWNEEQNEWDWVLFSADFKDLYTGLEAQAALWDYMKTQVLYYGKKYGYKTPTNDQLLFWSYLFYNRHHLLKSFKGKLPAATILKNNGSFAIPKARLDLTTHNPATPESKAYRFMITNNFDQATLKNWGW